MRTSRPVLTSRGFGVALRRVAAGVREAILLAWPVAILEQLAPYAEHDGFDFAILCAAGLATVLLAQGARAGWMPVTERAVRAVWTRLKAAARRLSPRYAVAFRPSPETPSLPDRTLTGPTIGLALLVIGLGALGGRTFDGLAFLKAHVSYTLYLAALAVVWGFMVATLLLCAISLQQWLGKLARRRGGGAEPYLLCLAGWVTALAAMIFVPGGALACSVLVLGWFGARALGNAPAQDYLFCRRDARGRARTIPVQTYLRQAHTLIVLALTAVVVLGHAERLWDPAFPDSRFRLTSWLGLMAGLGALVLTARASAHFRRLMGGAGVPPEVPLTPTLWLRRPPSWETGGAEERRDDYWYRLARESGWLVLRDPEEPELSWDLVLGSDDSSRRFVPRDPVDDDDARFQLERRFHVVMRRHFRRRFESLFKALRGEDPQGGTGFLFCPHVWLVPGVVRDIDLKERSGASGGLVGPTLYGPTYADAFPTRLRRYIGAVLRDLQIDVIYFEDSVTWKDIQRVLGVAYEVHDQRRSPLRERHFMGLPRVRVVIQEEAAEAEPPPTIPIAPPTGVADEAPGHARILLILRDRGQKNEDLAPDPADYGLRTPSLV